MNKKVYTPNDNLSTYVAQKFAHEPLNIRRDLEIYLCFLVYPKMVKTCELAIFDENNEQLFGREKAKKVARIKKLHSMLYNFSLDKCEHFFSDPFFCKIFAEYIKIFDERTEANPVIGQFKEVYQAALDLIQREFSIEVNSPSSA